MARLPEQVLTERSKWFMRLLAAVLVALVVSWLPFELVGRHGLRRYLELEQELTALRARNRRLARKVRDLAQDLAELRKGGDAVERVARDELGLIHDGEVVYVLRTQRR